VEGILLTKLCVAHTRRGTRKHQVSLQLQSPMRCLKLGVRLLRRDLIVEFFKVLEKSYQRVHVNKLQRLQDFQQKSGESLREAYS
jgi:hypothetical protein